FSDGPLNHPNVVFVLGGPGSGKGTQCTRLAQEFNLVHLSAGDLLRNEVNTGSEVGEMCSALMKEGKLVPMEITIGLLRKAMESHRDASGFLIDGFPRALDQAHEFERTIGPCRKALFYHCTLDILEQRLLERGKTSGRDDDNIDVIRKRFATFESQSMPVIDYYESQGKAVKVSYGSHPLHNGNRSSRRFSDDVSDLSCSTFAIIALLQISSIPPIEEVYAQSRSVFTDAPLSKEPELAGMRHG
ncbi:adenylate kinase-domain-containing protein, partial [Polychytrium aggregatum]|uniref:adenylate kinase-domain-containing protein n=1 Tax=Polychytrium aggregatum TaxID=110093 RepID=UPI0022FF03F3